MFSKNVKTVYLYSICLISLLMVIGGTIFAINSTSDLIIDGFEIYTLRSIFYSLAFVVVGLPIYIFHWKKADKELKESKGE